MMENEEKILEIKDLSIAFRTNGGTVKAVRGISLALNRGETLALVGESGSGKSVTAKAIMGLLAGNAVVENGEIIYDGKDLLKLGEAEFHNYRGSRIAMIFQDPLSSLNPIMKIGRQMTEALLVNGRAKRRAARRGFKSRLRNLCAFVNKEDLETVKTFKKTAVLGSRLHRSYIVRHERAVEAAADIADALIGLTGGEPKKMAKEIRQIMAEAGRTYHDYVASKDSRLPRLLDEIKAELGAYRKTGLKERLGVLLAEAKVILEEAADRAAPDFFALAYRRLCKKGAVSADDAQFYKESFYDGFAALVERAALSSNGASIEAKKKALETLKAGKRVFEGGLDKAVCLKRAGIMARAVEAAIDRCAADKDGWSHIFGASMRSYIKAYFKGVELNAREQRRYELSLKKYEKRLAKGLPAAPPPPPFITDLERLRRNMNAAIERLIGNYGADIAAYAASAKSNGARANGVKIIDLLLEDAKAALNRVGRQGAVNRAVRVMKEAGIPEPRRRFRQYPFELSGGMRQRIVIALALSSKPEILICDEPTTALDMTIQSQILESIKSMKDKYGLSVIFITHNLGVVAGMADRVAVMYAGKIVEYGLAEEIFHRPAHPYTWALLASMPDLDASEKLEAIPGAPPNMVYPPRGDAFAERNKYALKIDFELEPPEFPVSDTHWAATWLLHPKAPKVEPPKIVADRIERMKRYKES